MKILYVKLNKMSGYRVYKVSFRLVGLANEGHSKKLKNIPFNESIRLLQTHVLDNMVESIFFYRPGVLAITPVKYEHRNQQISLKVMVENKGGFKKKSYLRELVEEATFEDSLYESDNCIFRVKGKEYLPDVGPPIKISKSSVNNSDKFKKSD